jgi:predicted P-loop ATPase
VLQTLEGNEDYKTTLRLLPALGFPVTIKSDKVTADAIAEYHNGLGVRYDSFIQDLTMNGKIIEELDNNTLYIDMKKHFDKEVSRMRFEETIKSHYIQTINPIMDFIEANKDRHPVGTFEKWLDCLVLKNSSIDKAIVLHFFKKWYVGMVAQALDGEFPNEFFLTLLSVEQGIGKTTTLRNYTLPKELQVYMKEHSLSFDDDFKVLMAQALLIVDDEMDGRTYEMDKTFKTVLSTKELTTRRKYDRRISTIKRRCSFAGSGNNLAVVREQHNRRFLPIEIESIKKEKLSEVDLNDLFMEAYHLFANGFKYSFQHEDLSLLKQLYEDYVQKSDVDLIVDEYLQHPITIADVFYITNLDIVTLLTKEFPMSWKRINVPSIAKLMNVRGFDSARRGINRTTCYAISRSSRIMTLIFNDSQSWRLNIERLSGETSDKA